MTDYQDYMNTHKLYPDDISRRIDIPPGFDSVRDVNYTHETGATGATVKESLTTEREKIIGKYPNPHPDGCTRCKYLNAPEILYDYNSWDGGISFDNVITNFCPTCGRKLEADE